MLNRIGPLRYFSIQSQSKIIKWGKSIIYDECNYKTQEIKQLLYASYLINIRLITSTVIIYSNHHCKLSKVLNKFNIWKNLYHGVTKQMLHLYKNMLGISQTVGQGYHSAGASGKYHRLQTRSCSLWRLIMSKGLFMLWNAIVDMNRHRVCAESFMNICH